MFHILIALMDAWIAYFYNLSLFERFLDQNAREERKKIEQFFHSFSQIFKIEIEYFSFLFSKISSKKYWKILVSLSYEL